VSTALWLAFGLFVALIAAQLAVPDTRRMRGGAGAAVVTSDGPGQDVPA
jgi:hypothetical protein